MGGGLLQRLGEVLDELAAVDVDAVSDDEVHAAVVAIGTESTRLEAQWCRLIARWDRRQVWADNGSKAAAARLARDTHRRRGDCDRLVGRARDLAAMPVTAAAYAAGEICGRHVDLIASCNRPWRNAEFTNSEQLLVDLCRTPLFTVAQRGIEYWKQCADRDAADRDADTVKAVGICRCRWAGVVMGRVRCHRDHGCVALKRGACSGPAPVHDRWVPA